MYRCARESAEKKIAPGRLARGRWCWLFSAVARCGVSRKVEKASQEWVSGAHGRSIVGSAVRRLLAASVENTWGLSPPAVWREGDKGYNARRMSRHFLAPNPSRPLAGKGARAAGSLQGAEQHPLLARTSPSDCARLRLRVFQRTAKNGRYSGDVPRGFSSPRGYCNRAVSTRRLSRSLRGAVWAGYRPKSTADIREPDCLRLGGIA